MLTGTQIKTSLQNMLDVIPADDTKLLEWIQNINRETYRRIQSTAPEKLIKSVTVKSTADEELLTLPTDFKNVRVLGTGIYKTNNSGSYYQAIGYDAQTGTFTTGLTVTGGTSGATGIIDGIYDDGTTGVLTLRSVSGTFEDNEAITDTSTGAATINGDPFAFKTSDEALAETSFGSRRVGFWVGNGYLHWTPTPDQTNYFTLRYIPTLTDLATLSSETQIPNEFLEYASTALNIYVQQYLVDPSKEANANARFVNLLNTFIDDIKQTSFVYTYADLSTSF